MALLFMDGFSSGDITFRYTAGSQTYTPTTGSGSRVAGCYYGSFGQFGGGGVIKRDVTASAQIFVGVGFNGFSGQQWYISLCGDAGATQHISVVRNGSNLMEIRRGANNGTLLATGTTQVVGGIWYYLEVSCTISDTVGTVEVRLNGNPTPDVTYSGDTKNGGTANTIDSVFFSVAGGGAFNEGRISDIYILNSTGTTNNTFLGDVAVRTLLPNGDGAASQLTGSDGNQVANWQQVDDVPYSSADYNGSNVSGNRDTYAMADVGTGITAVYGVQLGGLMAKSDAGLSQSKLVVRSGGTNYYGSTRTLSTSYIGYTDIFETNPATGVLWTATDVNAAEGGMEVV